MKTTTGKYERQLADLLQMLKAKDNQISECDVFMVGTNDAGGDIMKCTLGMHQELNDDQNYVVFKFDGLFLYAMFMFNLPQMVLPHDSIRTHLYVVNFSLTWIAYRQFTWWIHGKLGQMTREGYVHVLVT